MTDHPVSDQIYTDLLALQEIPYRDFQRKLIPTVEPDRILGIRTPLLRRYARELAGHREAELFLAELPHAWFEQNQLHAFLLSGMKDYSACLAGVSRFLPYIDNWATCDQLSPQGIPQTPRRASSCHSGMAAQFTSLYRAFRDRDADGAFP